MIGCCKATTNSEAILIRKSKMPRLEGCLNIASALFVIRGYSATVTFRVATAVGGHLEKKKTLI
jgi:hypothetical protein